jgi:glycerol-3-phosphate dehydrogenase
VDQIVAFRAHDRRTTFVVPRGDVVYVGTTDTDYEGPADHPETTAGDVEYLLEAVNRSFVDVEIRPDTVCSAWAGLRPLLHEEGKAPSEVSRKDEIMVGPSGLISIAGGKLTTYRSMAARIVDLAREALERLGVRPSVVPCATDRLPLPGGGASGADLQGLEKRLADRYRDIPATTIARLVSTYGTQSETILLPVSDEPELGQPVAPGVRLLGAEIRYFLDHEMALALDDVLDRRTHLLLFGRDQGLAAVEPTAAALARRLRWSADRLDRESVAYRQLAATLRPTGRPSPARAQHGDGRHAKEQAR